ncbi:MAG: hypothetical protein HeimC3_30380 [Candidatus Heimdallarchaeota archaeon LC_3]|nr:MAG: hypothetical protein HeimC3_30380 [Candidatus Heimdallarchaeota archaeon LC_3]
MKISSSQSYCEYCRKKIKSGRAHKTCRQEVQRTQEENKNHGLILINDELWFEKDYQKIRTLKSYFTYFENDDREQQFELSYGKKDGFITSLTSP